MASLDREVRVSRHVTPEERLLLIEFGITNQWYQPRRHEFEMLDEIARLRKEV